MKKFLFKLEFVLSERKRIEDLRLGEWTLAKKILQGMMDQLTKLEQELVAGIEQATLIAGSQDGGNSGMYGAVDDFIAGQKTRIVWKTQQIERGARLTDKKRLEYVAARQKHEALEKLKARKLLEYRLAGQKQERKALDDIYIMSGAARRRIDLEDDEESLQ